MSDPVNAGVAIVTGSAQGIGRAIAERLIADGGDVMLLDLSPETAATATEIGAVGSVVIDVTDVEALQAAVRTVAVDHGRLDTLVNCAGTCGRDAFSDLTPEIWHRDLDTNLTAVAFACQAAVFPTMQTQGYGRIVNIASVSGMVGGVGPVHLNGSGGRSGAAYASAKAGSINLTRWLAREVGRWGITCNTVAPGPIQSQMTTGADYGLGANPVPRMGTAREVAAAVAYLVGPDSAYTTGTCLHVDGGMVLV